MRVGSFLVAGKSVSTWTWGRFSRPVGWGPNGKVTCNK